ncbi:MAG TPA: GTPase HflX [Patescibacteria group bacterium]
MINTGKRTRFLLVGVPKSRLSKEQIIKDMEELWSLVMTLGNAEIVDALVQRADRPDNATFIGRGKVEELYEKVKNEQIDVVVINNIVKAQQLHNVKMKLFSANEKIEVWDRVDLILFIFSLHAHTAEAKLQIDLAKMHHMGPRIYGMGKVLSNQAAGIGAVGIGETNTELMKRHWRSAINKVQEQLDKLSAEKEHQLERRKRLGLETVSIVGYTNAGKTALFNRLTGKSNLTENILFATLDSAIGKLYLPTAKKEIFITDTIGFIKNLPPTLIQAFTSTLIESIHADILLHVIDASDEDMKYKISVVEKILHDLKIQNKHKIYIFNKMDKAIYPKNELAAEYDIYTPIFISASKNEGIDEVKNCIDSLSLSATTQNKNNL